MKKVLSLVLVVAMMLSTMALGVNAATIGYASSAKRDVFSATDIEIGGLYTADGSYFKARIDKATALIVAPGSTIYMPIATYTNSGDYTYSLNSVKRIGIYPDSDSESKQLIARASSAEKKTLKTYNDKISYVCAAIPVKSVNITSNTYDETWFAGFEVRVEYKNNDETYQNSILAGYDVNNGFTDDASAAVYYYESQEDIWIEDEDGNFEIEATATGKATAKLTFNRDVIDEIEEIYGQYASLEYYNGTGSLTRIKNCKVTIAADGCRYLYKYEDGVLVDLSSYYNSSADAFEMKISGTSYTLGTYVVSDVKLSSVKAPSSTTTTTTTTTTGTAVKPVVPTTSGSTVKPVIPNTGVALELQ